MSLLGFVLVGLVAWGSIFYFLDRPAIPAYKVRDAYRLVVLLLFFLLLCLGYKAIVWHTELTGLVKSCR